MYLYLATVQFCFPSIYKVINYWLTILLRTSSSSIAASSSLVSFPAEDFDSMPEKKGWITPGRTHPQCFFFFFSWGCWNYSGKNSVSFAYDIGHNKVYKRNTSIRPAGSSVEVLKTGTNIVMQAKETVTERLITALKYALSRSGNCAWVYTLGKKSRSK